MRPSISITAHAISKSMLLIDLGSGFLQQKMLLGSIMPG
jgi:hypothetical protein